METLPFHDEPESTAPASHAAEGVAYVRVAVERGIDSGDGLTYRAEGLGIGARVEVPLGRGNKAATGFVVEAGGPELLEGFDPARVKPVLKADGVALLPELVELGRWMSGYYVCPLGMVLSTMMPAAVKSAVGRRTITLLQRRRDAAQDEPQPKLSPAARRAWERAITLPESSWPIEPKQLVSLIEAKNLAPINKLVAAGLLEEMEQTIVRAPEAFWENQSTPMATPPALTPQQAEIVGGIGSSLGSFSTHLLRGITGSGKTEVYLRLIERVLDAGNSALVLVPEIALTPQTAGRFLDRFRDRGVAVLHSGLTASARNQQWSAAASGEARVVVGARSAVFAPLPNLGLIVVDEEHDTSYKQDQLPRYNARDVAIKRAHIGGFPVLLGSATPSLESWWNTKPTRRDAPPRFALWELRERVAGGKLPSVEVVDLAAERRLRRKLEGRTPNQLDVLGPTLERAIDETVSEGGQAILLLNRRGFASYVACPDASCGWSMECDQCDATMVVHRAGSVRSRGYLRCHHCQSEQMIPKQCPLCARSVIELGVGTQRLEQDLERRFGTTLGLINGETMVRVDSDTMNSAKDYFDVLRRFGDGDIRVLLGTQMIAKGLDYPNVRLVGVVNADTAINLPDFRAAERTFQLVSQVAGRTGRGELAGRVIVQTMNPREPAIELAARHDYVAFADAELRVRAEWKLPPAWRMVRIVVRDESLAKAERLAADLAARLRDVAHPSVSVEGPAPCPIARVAGRYRHAIELRAPHPKMLQDAMAELREAGLLKSDAATAIDSDPVMLL